ncbi:hypothetical protein SD78_1390 [Bacillus badius]|nr:hypothetical protein SD78_1390 [Bacillus badius]
MIFQIFSSSLCVQSYYIHNERMKTAEGNILLVFPSYDVIDE